MTDGQPAQMNDTMTQRHSMANRREGRDRRVRAGDARPGADGFAALTSPMDRASPSRNPGGGAASLFARWRASGGARRRSKASVGIAPFNLSRWFAIVGLISIATISAVCAILGARFLTERMLRQEGVLTMEFVQSVVFAEKSLLAYFTGQTPRRVAELEAALNHISTMPDALRANVYNAQRKVIWSSDRELIGRDFGANEELDEALAGELVVHGETQNHHAGSPQKDEHVNFDNQVNFFVEIYIPIRDAPRGRVIGVVELYKNPRALAEALATGRTFTFIGAAIAGLFLYLTLFGLARRADGVIRAQRERLVQSETLVAVGEMGSAVAHGIRNPLASIRSSAELALDASPETAREAAEDIIAEADRLEEWVRELLGYTHPQSGSVETFQLGPVVEDALYRFAREMEKRNISGRALLTENLPLAKGDPLLLGQVLRSVLSNAMEAIERNGNIVIGARSVAEQRRVELTIRDSGPGMTPEQLRNVFQPFYTTKTRGLGVGLPLARRILERLGGRITIDSKPGQGTEVCLSMPIA